MENLDLVGLRLDEAVSLLNRESKSVSQKLVHYKSPMTKSSYPAGFQSVPRVIMQRTVNDGCLELVISDFPIKPVKD